MEIGELISRHTTAPHNTSPRCTARHHTTSPMNTAELDLSRRIIAVNSVETEAFKKRFLAMNVGDVLFRSEAIAISGGTPQNQRINYGAISTAKKQVLSEAGVFIDNIPTVGWKRLNASEASSTADRSRRHVTRVASNTLKVLEKVKPEELPASEQVTHHARATIMAALKFTGQTKQFTTIERRISNSGANQPLQLAESMKALQGS